MSSPDSKSRLAGLVEQAVRTAFPEAPATAVELDRPKNREHGDFATNVALQLARHVGRKPREVAEAIVKALPASGEIARSDIAGPGFINFTLAAEARFAVVPQVLGAGAAFGRTEAHKGHKIMVQVQSTLFPVIDRNPQRYVDNIFKARESDYIKARQRVFRSRTQPSHLLVPVVSGR